MGVFNRGIASEIDFSIRDESSDGIGEVVGFRVDAAKTRVSVGKPGMRLDPYALSPLPRDPFPLGLPHRLNVGHRREFSSFAVEITF